MDESQWNDCLFKSYKSLDQLMCITDCSRYDYCNLISFNQMNYICKHYFVDSINQGQFSYSQGMSLFYSPLNISLKARINQIYQEFSYLTSNTTNINKTTLTFYEFVKLQRQNAKFVTTQGSVTKLAIITSRRVYFSDGNWYSIFYMPSWSSYGEILYIEVNSGYTVTINKARTNLTSDLFINRGFLAMFVNDLVKWNYIATMNQTLFLASFN
jgi:hypothetical protein